MSTAIAVIHRLSASILFLLLATSALSAQTSSARSSQDQAAKTSIIIERQLVRFTTPGEPVEWRLTVTNQHGVLAFDSGLTYSNALEWPLLNYAGQAIESGLYTYLLTVKAANEETPRTQQGHLIVDRASSSDRVWLTSSPDTALGGGSETTKLSIIGSPETGIGGAEFPGGVPRRAGDGERSELPKRASDEAATGKASLALAPNATANRVAKFAADGTTPVDTQVSEINGAVVIGNAGATGNLQIFGQANADVFAGMGPDVANGPAFNFGYAGSSFGRSAGFFNVRPDASAVAPNPSLRFLTANQQRMIITNTGNVGIGTTAPTFKLQVIDSSNTGLRVQTNAAGGALASFGGFGEFQIDSPGNPAGRLRILENGKVGIGTVFPEAKLDVEGGDNAGIIGRSSGSFGEFGGPSGVIGVSLNGVGVEGSGGLGGVSGFSTNGFGVAGGSTNGFAGLFTGKVSVTGKVGIGTNNPGSNLHVNVPSSGTPISALTIDVQSFQTTANAAASHYFKVSDIGSGGFPAFLIRGDGNVGIGTSAPEDKLTVFGGFIKYFTPAAGGNTNLCWNASSQISFCSSSRRYKTNIAPLYAGLSLINRLRPVTFDWKQSSEHDLGLVAEEVAEVEPLLVSRNTTGEIEGVRYDRISVVLLNAVKEQQAQITLLQQQKAALERHTAEQDARLLTLEQQLRQLANHSSKRSNTRASASQGRRK